MKIDPLVSDTTTFDRQHRQQAEASGVGGQTRAASNVAALDMSLEAIRLDSLLQVRDKTNEARVRQYAAHMADGVHLPPVVIFDDGEHFWLGDGRHRVCAAKRNAYQSIQAEVWQGTERDAFVHSLQANTAHGLPLSDAEKRSAIDHLLQDAQWRLWSDHEIARHCGVSHTLVGRRRRQMTSNGCQSLKIRRVKRGQKIIEMNIANIGKGSASIEQAEARMAAHSLGESDQTVEPGVPEEVKRSDQPGNLASASASQSVYDHHQGIETAQRGSDNPLAESSEVAAHNEQVNLEPEESDHGGQPEPQEGPADVLPAPQASQAPLPALQSLLDGFEGVLSGFRVQYVCDEPITKEVLVSVEGGLQRARQILDAYSQGMEHDEGELDAKETATPKHDEPIAHDDHDAQGARSASEEAPTTACSEPPVMIRTFMAKRCTPSSDFVSQHGVMASITTWLDEQGFPPIDKREVTCELHRMGFRDSLDSVRNKANTNEGWQWQGFQLLPADAPDNEVDPFGSRNA